MKTAIIENELIENLAKNFSRSPHQYNRLQESDAELIRLPGTNTLLAVTTDGIVEEIDSGLYSDPYMIGWMTVIVNMSDLAAVGAEPIGILLSETLPSDADSNFLANLQRGIQDACSACGVHVLGGDTNFSTQLHMNACAFGIVSQDSPMTRMGARPGDHLYASGQLGGGSAYAFLQLAVKQSHGPEQFSYRPGSRIREGKLLRNYASCCMDTSDGLIATLDQLVRLNNIGFMLESLPEDYLNTEALQIAREAQLPPWIMLAGPHGEFELVFAVPPACVDPMLTAAAAQGWSPQYLGKVTDTAGIRLNLDNQLIAFDTGKIRNLFAGVGSDVKKYMKELLIIDAEVRGNK